MNAILKIRSLEISKAKEALFVIAFTALAVYAPYIVHFFGGANAGQRFLPMPFFVLLAGIFLGWRAGLATAIAAPLISFSISGMPAMQILPFIVLQMAVIGIVSGILRNGKNIIVSMAASMASGWLVIGIALFLFSKMSAKNYVISGIRNGFPGILLELILIPLIVIVINRYLSREEKI